MHMCVFVCVCKAGTGSVFCFHATSCGKGTADCLCACVFVRTARCVQVCVCVWTNMCVCV